MKIKKTLCFLLCLTMLAGMLVGCGKSDQTSTPEQTEESDPVASKGMSSFGGSIPSSEYERGIWYGFMEESLTDADPDSTVVTWKQYCTMLGKMIKAYDETLLPEWEAMTKDAPDIEMKRDGAMVALYMVYGMLNPTTENPDGKNPQNFFYPWGILGSQCEGYDYGNNATWDYPICSDDPNDILWPAFDTIKNTVSNISGKPIMEGIGDDFLLEKPLTVRDALLGVVRLYETDYEVAMALAERMMTEASLTASAQAVLDSVDALRAAIQNDVTEVEITGTTYYVSNSGNDSNDGLTPESAWATLDKVDGFAFQPGDGVLFERGDVFRGAIDCQKNVTYSAYGDGPMPILTGSPENGVGTEKWSLYGETSDGGKVWMYYKDMLDCGSLILNDGNDGSVWASKITPYWINGQYCNEDGSPFEVLEGLGNDMMFFSPADSVLKTGLSSGGFIAGVDTGIFLSNEEYTGSTGALYFRCDAGNPGEVFDSIEFSVSPKGAGHSIVAVHDGVLLNNLHLTAAGDSTIGEATHYGKYTVQNCELSYAGGNVLYYDHSGAPTRAGDLLGTTSQLTIVNCYLHDAHDSHSNGITVEVNDKDSRDYAVENITVTGCLFENNYEDLQLIVFDEDMRERGIVYRNITVENNYFMFCGAGWTNDNDYGSTSIKLGDFNQPLDCDNVVFRNNIIYSAHTRSHIYGSSEGYDTPPVFENNRLFIRPLMACLQLDENSAVALWTSDVDKEIEAYDDFVRYFYSNHEEFLNGYLGSGNTVELMW